MHKFKEIITIESDHKENGKNHKGKSKTMSGFQAIEELQTELNSENIDHSEEDLSLKFSSLFAHPDFLAHVKYSKIVDKNIDTSDSCAEIHTDSHVYILEEDFGNIFVTVKEKKTNGDTEELDTELIENYGMKHMISELMDMIN